MSDRNEEGEGYTAMKDYFIGLWEFVKAYGKTVSSALTGSITVVSGIVSTYATQSTAKIVFGVTAVLAFIASANELWQHQRKRVIELEDKLAPMLQLSFNSLEQGCVISLPTFKAYRLKVENIGEQRLTECRGHLKSIAGYQKKFDAQSILMPFSPSELSEAYTKTIVKGVPEFLDLFTISDNNEIELHCQNIPNGFNQNEFFRQPGDYTFDISVSSREAPGAEFKFIVGWTGNWMFTNVRPA